MMTTHILNLQALFEGRQSIQRVPLGWDWFVVRCGLFFEKKPNTDALLHQARRVLNLEDEISKLSFEELQSQLLDMRSLFRMGKEQDADLIRAMALIREMAHHIRKEKPYATQVAGALGILQNCIVEMATGEGKTLTAALAAVVAGWRGKGCHVVTSNDYLATRDAATMQKFYAACGLSSAAVAQDHEPVQRKMAYACDITYLTSKDAAADFLRDQINLGQNTSYERVLTRVIAGQPMPDLVQRGLSYAIVDEADSVLCDGGSTPLVISTPRENAPRVEQYITASEIADTLKSGVHFKTNRTYREASLTDLGKKNVIATTLQKNAWAKRSRAIELVTQALEAREFFKKDVQYVIHEEKVVIVDEGTGRIMPDHEWRDGLHQAVSAKEGTEVVPPRATSMQTTFQDFFLRYKVLGGMTGTAWEARRELLHFYRLSVVRIPTHRACRRKRVYRFFHQSTHDKIADIVRCIEAERQKGRAVLVGTKSIKASESISEALTERHIPHEVLTALQHEQEADIIARAGHPHAVTVATNMAGRGTDIKLVAEVKEHGGLHVILTEMHTSARIDRQLYGRSGRQGDPGSWADIICMEDDLLLTLPAWVRRILHTLLNIKGMHTITHSLLWTIVTLAQYLGDRKALRMRKNMIKHNQQFTDMMSYSGKKH